MAYDMIIKNGKMIDGSGLPGFHGDVAVSGGRIVEIGKVSGEGRQVLNADGLVVAPGIIDNHTHYDAQVTWDPLCTYSCYHGITTVVMGNCSLAMAPAHQGRSRDACRSFVPCGSDSAGSDSSRESTGPGKRFPSISMLWINGWALTWLPSSAIPRCAAT